MARRPARRSHDARDFGLVGLAALLLATEIIVVIVLYGTSIGWDLGATVTGRGGSKWSFGIMLLIAAIFLFFLVAAGIGAIREAVRVRGARGSRS